MRIATVIGRVTLSVRRKELVGERLLLVKPWRAETLRGEDKFDPSIVVYDQLGANVGQTITFSEGREAACPFPKPTPVDAYCAALVDDTFYKD
jgi:ethanolamine utilization protein EutN